MYAKIENFFLAPASPKPLGVLRIGLCVVLLLQAWMCVGQFFDLYGTYGILQNTLGERFGRGGVPQPLQIAHLFSSVGISENLALEVLGGLYVFFLFTLLVGAFTRVSAIGAWGLHLIFAQGHFTGYGVDLYSHFALFYAIFMPMGKAYSVDCLREKERPSDSWDAGLSLRVWQIHLCIAYLATGSEKLMGEQWRNGEAVWRSLNLPLYRQFDMSWLAGFSWVALLLAWGTLAIEIGYPFLIFPMRTRRLWVALTISLHLGIGLFLGLHLFALLMSLLTFCCFGMTYSLAPLRAGER